MNIEIKKSIKPVNYFDAINILESRLKDLYENNEQELIWTLEHNEVFTAGTSYKENEIIDKSIKVTATCVRVPVFVGHSEAVNIEFENFLDEDEARNILGKAPGIIVVDERKSGGYITPIESVGEFATYVSRIRQDSTIENGLNLWCVSDNLRKGAALNTVQIAEILGQKILKKG